ncbi:MAG: alkaline phosphatase family protein [Candidatus Thorarchaeota archaeon]
MGVPELKPLLNREDLFYPDLDTNISKVLPTLLTLFKRKFPKERTLERELKSIEGWRGVQESEISNVIFIVLDALGFNHFQKYSTWLKDKFDTNGTVLSSVFPTITSTCLTSFHHGIMPIKHGILGHKIYFREIDNVMDTLTLKTKSPFQIPLDTAGVNVNSWLWSPILLTKNEDLKFVNLIESYLANSGGLSNFLFDTPTTVGYYSPVDCYSAAQRILEKTQNRNLFLNIYAGSIDAISHRYSPENQALAFEIQNIEFLMQKMFKRLNSDIRKKTAIVITADHGQEPLSEENRITVSNEEELFLSKLIKNRGRSGRVIHLYSKDDKKDELVEWAQEKIADKGVVLTSKDYPSLMGKGADNERIVERLGDVQIVLGKEASLYFGHSGEYDPEFQLGINATHGSLSTNELLVPFIIGKIDDFIS